MSRPQDTLALLHAFYLGALGAELAFAAPGEFAARMASFYCRLLMALEAHLPADDVEVAR